MANNEIVVHRVGSSTQTLWIKDYSSDLTITALNVDQMPVVPSGFGGLATGAQFTYTTGPQYFRVLFWAMGGFAQISGTVKSARRRFTRTVAG